jgi:hypothetical protein
MAASKGIANHKTGDEQVKGKDQETPASPKANENVMHRTFAVEIGNWSPYNYSGVNVGEPLFRIWSKYRADVRVLDVRGPKAEVEALTIDELDAYCHSVWSPPSDSLHAQFGFGKPALLDFHVIPLMYRDRPLSWGDARLEKEPKYRSHNYVMGSGMYDSAVMVTSSEKLLFKSLHFQKTLEDRDVALQTQIDKLKQSLKVEEEKATVKGTREKLETDNPSLTQTDIVVETLRKRFGELWEELCNVRRDKAGKQAEQNQLQQLAKEEWKTPRYYMIRYLDPTPASGANCSRYLDDLVAVHSERQLSDFQKRRLATVNAELKCLYLAALEESVRADFGVQSTSEGFGVASAEDVRDRVRNREERNPFSPVTALPIPVTNISIDDSSLQTAVLAHRAKQKAAALAARKSQLLAIIAAGKAAEVELASLE